MTELLQRLLDRDVTLWPDGNVAPTRLGWLDIHAHESTTGFITKWAAGIDAAHVILLGMGGSSLGPEVLRASVGSKRLTVLDTTDPATVADVDLSDASS